MKKALRIVLMLFISSVAAYHSVSAQGCVAVRPMSCAAAGNSFNYIMLTEGQWQAGASYRYFRSYKHFRGDEEEKERVEQGTEVINVNHSVEFSLNHALTNRLSLSLNIPLIYYDRSSLYEHYGNNPVTNPEQKRFHTGATGLGDVRISAYYWLFDPTRDSLHGNIAIGMGVKTPTGNANVLDEFHKRAADGKDSITVRPVDQSIQLGDDGWGVSLEAQALWRLSKNKMLYFNGFYLFNPRNVNNTLTSGTLPPVTSTSYLTAYHSVADQYAARLGVNFNAFEKHGIATSLGFRMEGIPSKDLIGDNEGFRRPGYIFSIEPGIVYMVKNLNFSLLVPIALYRNRTKSYADLERDKMDPSVDHHGDAAFADYLINFNVAYFFGRKASH